MKYISYYDETDGDSVPPMALLLEAPHWMAMAAVSHTCVARCQIGIKPPDSRPPTAELNQFKVIHNESNQSLSISKQIFTHNVRCCFSENIQPQDHCPKCFQGWPQKTRPQSSLCRACLRGTSPRDPKCL